MYNNIMEFSKFLDSLRKKDFEVFDVNSELEAEMEQIGFPYDVSCHNDYNQLTDIGESTVSKVFSHLYSDYKKYGVSEEFTAMFVMSCNFILLMGLEMHVTDETFELIYSTMDDPAAIRFYKKIASGIFKNNYDELLDAYDMTIDEGMPSLVMEMYFCILAIQSILEGKQDNRGINSLVKVIANIKNTQPDWIKNFFWPSDNEEDIIRLILDPYYKVSYLPRIVWGDRKGALEKLMFRTTALPEGIDINNLSEGAVDIITYYQSISIRLIKYATYNEMNDNLGFWFAGNQRSLNDLKTQQERSFHLKLVCMLPRKKYENICKYANASEKCTALRTALKRVENMLADYSHTISNTLQPYHANSIRKYIKNIEESMDPMLLKSNSDFNNIFNDIYRTLDLIYFSEKITKYECRLTRLAVGAIAGNVDVHHSISESKNTKFASEIISFYEMFDETIQMLFYDIIYDNHRREEYIRNKLSKEGFDCKSIDITKFDFKNKFGILFNVAEELKQVRLNDDKLGTTFMKSRILELLRNAFTYAHFGNDTNIKMSVNLEDQGSRKYIVFTLENTVGTRDFKSSGIGLSSTAEKLKVINLPDDDFEGEFVKSTEKDGVFATKIYFTASLYMDED